MQINIKSNHKNIIESYATIGKVEGGIDVETEYDSIDDIPPLSAGYYKLTEGKITMDKELRAQIETTHSDKNAT